MTTAFLQGHSVSRTGEKCAFWTLEVPVMVKSLRWQDAGLSFTASGYGKKIPTRYMVKFNGKWRRVYICQYANSGTTYIGKLSTNEPITVDFYA